MLPTFSDHPRSAPLVQVAEGKLDRLCSTARFGHIGISCPSCCRHGFATKANCEPTMLCDQKLLHRRSR